MFPYWIFIWFHHWSSVVVLGVAALEGQQGEHRSHAHCESEHLQQVLPLLLVLEDVPPDVRRDVHKVARHEDHDV